MKSNLLFLVIILFLTSCSAKHDNIEGMYVRKTPNIIDRVLYCWPHHYGYLFEGQDTLKFLTNATFERNYKSRVSGSWKYTGTDTISVEVKYNNSVYTKKYWTSGDNIFQIADFIYCDSSGRDKMLVKYSKLK